MIRYYLLTPRDPILLDPSVDGFIVLDSISYAPGSGVWEIKNKTADAAATQYLPRIRLTGIGLSRLVFGLPVPCYGLHLRLVRIGRPRASDQEPLVQVHVQIGEQRRCATCGMPLPDVVEVKP